MGLLHGIGLFATFALATAEAGGFLVLRQADAWRGAIEPPSFAVSADGRFVAFTSRASLLAADTNGVADVYVFDTRAGQVTLESIGFDGRAADGASAHAVISADGRMIAFESTAGNLVENGRSMARSTIYLRDRARGETRQVTVGISGARPDGASYGPSISADGRMLAFESNATNLVTALDANGAGADVYVTDLSAGTTERVSVTSAGSQLAFGTSFTPYLSADGSRVAFTSTADLECAGAEASCPPWLQDTNGLADVYVRDLRSASTRRVSRGLDGAETLAPSHHAALSADGRFVAFVSAAENLVPNDRNRTDDVFLYDVATATTTLVTRRADGDTSGNGRSLNPDISADGRFVGYQSEATDLVCARRCKPLDVDRNDTWDVFLFDARTERTERVSADHTGQPCRHTSVGIRFDSRAELVAFQSMRPTGPHENQLDYDLFLRWMSGLGNHDLERTPWRGVPTALW